MTDRKISSIQLNIWIVTASIGPIIFYSEGNWNGALLWGVIISLLVWSAMRFGRHWDGIVYNVIQCIWLAVVLSQLLHYSADCWPTGKRTFPVVPLVLLALAAVTALKGSKCTASGICILFWGVVFLLGIVFVAGVPEMDLSCLVHSEYSISAPMMLAFALPAVGGFLPCGRFKRLPYIIIVSLAVGVSVWISGILSPAIAKIVEWPFYEASKSVQLFNVAKRLEALVSAGVTVSNYALYSLLLCGVNNIGEKWKKGREAVVVAVGVSTSLMLLGVVLDPAISVIASLILWMFLPLLGMLKMKQEE